MNGGHDLGGMHGLGPIAPEAEKDEPVFHSTWEKRVFALNLAAAFLRTWNLDESRYARERQHPADYIRNSYYENWLNGLETLLVEKGLVTAEELQRGAPDPSGGASEFVPLQASDVETTLLKGGPADMEVDQRPRFDTGHSVRVVNINPTGHTRLPRYARGKQGVVRTHYGAHVFPDRHALGTRAGEHLYSVGFLASELWGEELETDFKVHLDLWEPYLAAE
ncbi:MAG: nitrile hydratase [Pseudomonadota bacterium]|nr:MAG: nitrile hydratase [Pseudomonadota bacterium]